MLRAQAKDAGDSEAEDAEVIRVATTAERRRLIELRDKGTIGDAAFQQVEQELDLRRGGAPIAFEPGGACGCA